MNHFTIFAVFAVFGTAPALVAAQVPHLLSYQGRVASGNTNFEGIGYFKFAFVSGGSNQTAQASATATVVNGFVVAISITSGGMGYASPPAVTISDPTGSGAAAVAAVSSGAVTSITLQDAGFGYTSPNVAVDPPPQNITFASYWSNDGTSTAGSEPVSTVRLSVSRGLFTVLLGDSTITNMIPISPSVFGHDDVKLRIWFGDGPSGLQQLSPDQRIAAVGYAMMADTVADGSITSAKLASNTITAANIAPGSIGAAQLAEGSITQSKLAPNLNLGTPSGAIVLSSEPDATNLTAAGYTRFAGVKILTEEWRQLGSSNAISAREDHSAVWTGTEMIVWGGSDEKGLTATGGRYNPVGNDWTPLPTNAAPQARYFHSAFWTGSEMIVWGGTLPSQRINSGGVLNLASNTWRAMSTSNAPPSLSAQTVICTGNELVVWGGISNAPVGVGARYDIAADRWSPTSISNSPSARYGHVAVWTGTEMIIWGGPGPGLNTGAGYTPSTDSWRTMSTNGAPQVSFEAQAVWTGTEVFIWVGSNGPEAGAYNPSTDTWRSLNNVGPGTREPRTALWTGSQMWLVVGIQPVSGAMYNPVDDQWTPFSTVGAPHLDGSGSSVVFANDALLIFGAQRAVNVVNSFAPARPLFLYQKP